VLLCKGAEQHGLALGWHHSAHPGSTGDTGGVTLESWGPHSWLAVATVRQGAALWMCMLALLAAVGLKAAAARPRCCGDRGWSGLCVLMLLAGRMRCSSCCIVTWCGESSHMGWRGGWGTRRWCVGVKVPPCGTGCSCHARPRIGLCLMQRRHSSGLGISVLWCVGREASVPAAGASVGSEPRVPERV
jgi:hypothetical protein